MDSILDNLLRDVVCSHKTDLSDMASEHLDCDIIADLYGLCDDFAPGIHTSNEMQWRKLTF